MAIACKVKELLETQGAITPAPGQSPDARMVLSRTGKQPLCSHAIAAMCSSGKLSIAGCCLTSNRKTTAQCDQACNRNDSERKRAKGVKLQLGGKPPRWLTTGANSIPSRLPLSQSVLQGHSCHLCLFGVTLLHPYTYSIFNTITEVVMSCSYFRRKSSKLKTKPSKSQPFIPMSVLPLNSVLTDYM